MGKVRVNGQWGKPIRDMTQMLGVAPCHMMLRTRTDWEQFEETHMCYVAQ